MSLPKGPWLTALGGVAVVAALAFAGSWARRPGPGCALDGVTIDPAYRVEVVDAAGARHAFCCPACAKLWLEHQASPPRAILVTDEASGEAIPAADAWYVRSRVVTAPTSGNRIHAFRSRADAERHAERNGGIVLPESESPFHQ